MRKARKPQSGDKDAVLAALKQQALRGGQGRVAAGRAWLDHTEGRPPQKQVQNQFQLSEEVAQRLCVIAEKLAGQTPCPKCGYVEPKPTAQATAIFPAFTPPEPPKASAVEAEERPALMRQPPTVIENPDPLLDHKGQVPSL